MQEIKFSDLQLQLRVLISLACGHKLKLTIPKMRDFGGSQVAAENRCYGMKRSPVKDIKKRHEDAPINGALVKARHQEYGAPGKYRTRSRHNNFKGK